MSPLTRVHGEFEAHVLAARLHSEGIDVELRGAIGGPYAFTVGDFARVDLYVPDDQMEDAQLVLLAVEVDDALAPPREWSGRSERPARWVWWVALALLAVLALGVLLSHHG